MSVVNKWPQGFQRALQALYSHEPVTDADMEEHRRLVARQTARDAARLSPSPQMELEAANDASAA